MLTMQTIVVFEIFIFKPEIFAIFFKIRITPSVEIGGPSNIMEVSSAYCDIFHSSPSIIIPYDLCYFVLEYQVSMHIREKDREI